MNIAIVTFQIESVVEERHGSEHDLLQDDSEAVDVSFLSSIDRSSCHTQQFRCCPQLITVILTLLAHVCHLHYYSMHFFHNCITGVKPQIGSDGLLGGIVG